MKRLLYILLLCITSTVACEKLNIDLENGSGSDPSSEGGGTEVSDTTEFGSLRDGSQSRPFLPSDFGSNGAVGAIYSRDSLVQREGIWVRGYIVGYQTGKNTIKLETGGTGTNIVLADSIESTDKAYMLAIQLPAGSLRDALNISNNPSNLHRPVKVCGSIDQYYSSWGLKSPTKYIWL